MRPHRRKHRVESAVGQRRDFGACAGRQHRIETCVDRLPKCRPFGRQEERDAGGGIEQRPAARRVEGDEAPVERFEDFERAQQALRVARPQTRRSSGIDRRKACVKVGRGQAFGAGTDTRRTSAGTGGMAERPCSSALK